jgi:hypothetical protein
MVSPARPASSGQTSDPSAQSLAGRRTRYCHIEARMTGCSPCFNGSNPADGLTPCDILPTERAAIRNRGSIDRAASQLVGSIRVIGPDHLVACGHRRQSQRSVRKSFSRSILGRFFPARHSIHQFVGLFLANLHRLLQQLNPFADCQRPSVTNDIFRPLNLEGEKDTDRTRSSWGGHTRYSSPNWVMQVLRTWLEFQIAIVQKIGKSVVLSESTTICGRLRRYGATSS